MQMIIIILALATIMYALISEFKEENMGEYPSRATKIGEAIMTILVIFIFIYFIVAILTGIWNAG